MFCDEGDRVSFEEIIDLRTENFTILPTAFDSKNLYGANDNIYDFEVMRQIPNITFAMKCNQLGTDLLRHV